ncbi:MAG: GatB/YqeY domain-containing protein [Bacteroidota bacterium]
MSLAEQINTDLKTAMKARDADRVATLRLIRAAFLEFEKSGAGALTDEKALAILQKQAKQRRESITQFESAEREDLAAKERTELAIIEDYLPKQLSDDEIAARVAAIVAETGASSMADMGKVMGRAMGALRGLADGNRVRKAVELHLKGGE